MNAYATSRLRVASWNLHSCRGIDRREDPNRTLAVIDSLDADLIALQEVPTESSHKEFKALLTGRRDYQAIVETTLPGHPDGFGNALLSRLPLHDARRLNLTVAGREPRCVIAAEATATDGTSLHVLTTHLGLKASERRTQLALIEAHLATVDSPCLVLGDFNAWPGWPSECLPKLQPARRGQFPRSFPALIPLLRLDRILASPPIVLRDAQAWRGSGLRTASDHLPVVAEVALACSA